MGIITLFCSMIPDFFNFCKDYIPRPTWAFNTLGDVPLLAAGQFIGFEDRIEGGIHLPDRAGRRLCVKQAFPIYRNKSPMKGKIC